MFKKVLVITPPLIVGSVMVISFYLYMKWMITTFGLPR